MSWSIPTLIYFSGALESLKLCVCSLALRNSYQSMINYNFFITFAFPFFMDSDDFFIFQLELFNISPQRC